MKRIFRSIVFILYLFSYCFCQTVNTNSNNNGGNPVYYQNARTSGVEPATSGQQQYQQYYASATNNYASPAYATYSSQQQQQQQKQLTRKEYETNHIPQSYYGSNPLEDHKQDFIVFDEPPDDDSGLLGLFGLAGLIPPLLWLPLLIIPLILLAIYLLPIPVVVVAQPGVRSSKSDDYFSRLRPMMMRKIEELNDLTVQVWKSDQCLERFACEVEYRVHNTGPGKIVRWIFSNLHIFLPKKLQSIATAWESRSQYGYKEDKFHQTCMPYRCDIYKNIVMPYYNVIRKSIPVQYRKKVKKG